MWLFMWVWSAPRIAFAAFVIWAFSALFNLLTAKFGLFFFDIGVLAFLLWLWHPEIKCAYLKRKKGRA